MNLNDLRDEAFENAKKHGFHDDTDSSDIKEILTSIALMHSELGEATEAVRKNRRTLCDPIHAMNTDEGFEKCVKDTLEDELADTVIRILDFCGWQGIDIDSHVKAKMEYNKSRPYRHGKAV
jgi:NTP pyrophosphatase (non-canonical NTP hydrolase)